jgi:hypothetical protein
MSPGKWGIPASIAALGFPYEIIIELGQETYCVEIFERLLISIHK